MNAPVFHPVAAAFLSPAIEDATREAMLALTPKEFRPRKSATRQDGTKKQRRDTRAYPSTVRAMAAAGRTVAEIAAACQCTREHIYRLARTHGITISGYRPQHRRKRGPA